MKLGLTIFLLLFTKMVFSQSDSMICDTIIKSISTKNIENENDLSPNSGKLYKTSINKNIDNDSTWKFPLFTINLSTGIWIPTGKLVDYFNPSLQIGFGFGLQISDKLRLEYNVLPRFINNKENIDININDSIISTDCPSSASIGGWLAVEIYNRKNILVEVISGLSWESLSTNVGNPNPKNQKDKKIMISTIGISLGVNTWVKKFGNQNFGFSLWYNYASYNYDSLLVSEIGGHYLTFSLVSRLAFSH